MRRVAVVSVAVMSVAVMVIVVVAVVVDLRRPRERDNLVYVGNVKERNDGEVESASLEANWTNHKKQTHVDTAKRKIKKVTPSRGGLAECE